MRISTRDSNVVVAEHQALAEESFPNLPTTKSEAQDLRLIFEEPFEMTKEGVHERLALLERRWPDPGTYPTSLIPQVAEQLVRPSLFMEIEFPGSIAHKTIAEQSQLPAIAPIDPLVQENIYQQGLRTLIATYDIDNKATRDELRRALSLLVGPDRNEIVTAERLFSEQEIKRIAFDTLNALTRMELHKGGEESIDDLSVVSYGVDGLRYSLLEVTSKKDSAASLLLHYSHLKYEPLLADLYRNGFQGGYEQFSVLGFSGVGGVVTTQKWQSLPWYLDIPHVGKQSADHISHMHILRRKLGRNEVLENVF